MKHSMLDAIQRGRERAQEGRSRREQKFFSTPASPNKLIRLFNTEFQNHDYGNPLPLAQKTRGMLNGFIRLGRNNGWNEKRFYDLIKEVVHEWPALRRKEIRSLQGKKILLSDRPSLLEFLVARDSIISNLREIKRIEVMEEKPKQTTIQTKKKQFGPTEAEMEAEMQRQMEDYY